MKFNIGNLSKWVAVLLLSTGAVQGEAALSEPVDGMVYDDVLNLCWLQDVSRSGPLTWANAVAWAEGLEHGGHSDWRLARMSSSSPTTSITTCTAMNEEACRTSGNELGYMFFYNLPGYLPKTGNQGPFTNIPSLIWSDTEHASLPYLAWVFNAYYGHQPLGDKGFQHYAWAVRSGQCRVAPKPIPTVSAWGLGLLGLLLAGLARARLR